MSSFSSVATLGYDAGMFVVKADFVGLGWSSTRHGGLLSTMVVRAVEQTGHVWLDVNALGTRDGKH